MLYQEGLTYLYSLRKFARKQNLLNIETLLKLLSKPHKSLKFIHITGTDGKGSTCAFIKSILKEAGYKVGLFISPHLTSLRERISINDELISKEEFIDLLLFIKPYLEQTYQYTLYYPIFFEVITAIALLYFKKKEVDFVVLEVGLGGRIDATNVVTPLVSVITNIELEHTKRLGITKEAIAKEKAEIIKKGIPVVTAETDETIIKIFQNICEEQNTSLTEIHKSYQWKVKKRNEEGQTFLLKDNATEFTIKMFGQHQIINALTAMKTVELLCLKIKEDKIKLGLTKTKWSGRLEVVSRNPLIVLDGAHTLAGVKVLLQALDEHFKNHKIIFIISILKDKNIEEMIQQIITRAEEIVVTESLSYRAIPAYELEEKFKKYFSKIHTEKNIIQAIDYARQRIKNKTLICFTGSLYLIGAARGVLINDVPTD